MAFGFPVLLKKSGSCGTRAYSPQTVLAEIPRLFCAARHGSRGIKVKTISVPTFLRARESILNFFLKTVRGELVEP